MNDLRVVLAVARKDLLHELRSRAATVATLFFSAVTLVMMAFALGREQHVMTLAAPGVLWVALTFYFGGHDSSTPHGVTIQLSLDPATLELSDPDQVEVSYYPSGPSWDDYYALTEGGLTVTEVTVVDETTLRIAGSFSGYFSHQTDFDRVHDPATAVEGEGEFVVERVVGSQLALELLEEGSR